ncbi:DUF6650 family protein [Streptacidiphilus sp. PAMC 29251]
MGVRPTGFSTPIVGLSWEFTRNQKDVARKVLLMLEDRHVLDQTRSPSRSDPDYCVRSALECRTLLSGALENTKPGGDLAHELSSMRQAFSTFAHSGDPDGERYRRDAELFRLAIEQLRGTVVPAAERIAEKFKLEPPQWQVG